MALSLREYKDKAAKDLHAKLDALEQGESLQKIGSELLFHLKLHLQPTFLTRDKVPVYEISLAERFGLPLGEFYEYALNCLRTFRSDTFMKDTPQDALECSLILIQIFRRLEQGGTVKIDWPLIKSIYPVTEDILQNTYHPGLYVVDVDIMKGAESLSKNTDLLSGGVRTRLAALFPELSLT